MTPESAAARTLVDLMAEAPRGPKQDGLFALWLTLRVVEDLAVDPPHPDRAVRRRATLLARRLDSLTLPTSLRRGLHGVVAALPDAGSQDAATLLALLATSAREGLGPEVGETVLRGLRSAPPGTTLAP